MIPLFHDSSLRKCGKDQWLGQHYWHRGSTNQFHSLRHVTSLQFHWSLSTTLRSPCLLKAPRYMYMHNSCTVHWSNVPGCLPSNTSLSLSAVHCPGGGACQTSHWPPRGTGTSAVSGCCVDPLFPGSTEAGTGTGADQSSGKSPERPSTTQCLFIAIRKTPPTWLTVQTRPRPNVCSYNGHQCSLVSITTLALGVKMVWTQDCCQGWYKMSGTSSSPSNNHSCLVMPEKLSHSGSLRESNGWHDQDSVSSLPLMSP